MATYFTRFPERGMTVACDGKCAKAWSLRLRPAETLDANDPADVAWFADDECGDAPADNQKPSGPEAMNEWCIQCCERSDFFPLNVDRRRMETIDWSKRVNNHPWKHPAPSVPAKTIPADLG